MAPEIGRKYGPYEVLGRLGGGGKGYVFRAWDARLDREVALKLLQNESAMPSMRERFLREARAASALNHPSICTIFDIGEQNGDPYLVMELLEGETLRDRIHDSNMPVGEIVCIAREVAGALGAAHAKGVVHSDIKPANIFLVPKPNRGVGAKVLDFGVAKIEKGVSGGRSRRSLDLAAVGATVGTLAYMSPEQARGEPLDSRSDLFSLGVVMYEMATRRIPFQGATSALVFVQLLNHPPEPVRSWNEAVPRDLEKIILKLMAKERTARFQTAQELDEALAKLSEKNAGWLRKAVSTVPLVRTSGPLAQDERQPRRRDLHREMDAPREPSAARFAPRSGPLFPDSVGPSSAEGSQMPAVCVPSGDRGVQQGGERAEFVPPAMGLSATAKPSRAGLAEAEDSRSGAFAAEASATPSRSSTIWEPDFDEPLGDLPGLFDEEQPELRRVQQRLFSGPAPIAMAIVAVLALIVAGALLARHGLFRHALVSDRNPMVLTEIENRTGNRMLDGTVAEALQIALTESPYFLMRSGDSYRAARRSLQSEAGGDPGQPMAQRAALRMGAKFYLFGGISGAGSSYVVHVDLLDTYANDVRASVEEHVPGLQALPEAVDRLAVKLRRAGGEDEGSIREFNHPLRQGAAWNLQALHCLREGEDALAAGKLLEALQLYRQAAALDGSFIEVQLRLAILYRKQRAEVASGEAAKLALAAAGQASERTRTFAQYEYEKDASGDYSRAAAAMRSYLAKHPHDSGALEALAGTLRLEGRVGEALGTAQQAYTEEPYNAAAYTQAENALLGLDRYEAAGQVEAQARKLGLENSGTAFSTMYLEGRHEELQAAIAGLQAGGAEFHQNWSYGLYLDNLGQLAVGSALWRGYARVAAKVPGLQSTAAFLLAQGALDRALLGDCKQGKALAHESATHPQGMTALFNTGIAEAICGDEMQAAQIVERLQRTYPQSFAVRGFYLADLQAALALHDNNPSAALEILRPARQFDLISLTPLLRGQAHMMLHQARIAIMDFQTVLSHRGLPFIVGNVVYPVAQVGVARAFAATGDTGNSAQAYRRFLELWETADANQPLLKEARAHSLGNL